MGKASLGKASNILGINSTPAPATKELADTQSAVMGLAPCLELGGKPRTMSFGIFKEAAGIIGWRLAIGKGDSGTAAGSCTRPGSTQANVDARHWPAAKAKQLPRGQVTQDRSVNNTREPTEKQTRNRSNGSGVAGHHPTTQIKAGEDAGTNKSARRKPAANL